MSRTRIYIGIAFCVGLAAVLGIFEIRREKEHKCNVQLTSNCR